MSPCTCSGKTWPSSSAWRSPSDVQGQGVGRRLVDACWDAARELEIKTVFTLTYVPGFFEKCGYHRIDKADLPHKIWNECVRCPLFPNCKEVALARPSSAVSPSPPERADGRLEICSVRARDGAGASACLDGPASGCS